MGFLFIFGALLALSLWALLCNQFVNRTTHSTLRQRITEGS